MLYIVVILYCTLSILRLRLFVVYFVVAVSSSFVSLSLFFLLFLFLLFFFIGVLVFTEMSFGDASGESDIHDCRFGSRRIGEAKNEKQNVRKIADERTRERGYFYFP